MQQAEVCARANIKYRIPSDPDGRGGGALPSPRSGAFPSRSMERVDVDRRGAYPGGGSSGIA